MLRAVLRTVSAVVLCCVLIPGCTRPPAAPRSDVFFPDAPATPRVQFLTSYSSSADVVPERGGLSRLVLGDDDGAEAVVKPYGVAMRGDRLYVCDTERNVVEILDLGGHRFGYMGGGGTERLRKPINVCVDPDGATYVADALRGEIVVFDALDAWTGVFGGDVLDRPVDVAVGGDRIYVCDAGACAVQVFDRADHSHLATFGSKGDGEGRFAMPTNIAMDPDGNIVVSDTLNGRLQVLAPDGAFVRAVGGLGDTPGSFARPKGVAVDREGRLFVVDAAFENVQILAPDGRPLMHFGGAGEQPGQFTLPAQVVVIEGVPAVFADLVAPGFRADAVILVTSQYGPRKVNVFAFGEARP